MTGGPSIVFTRKVLENETFIRKSDNLFISIIVIDAIHYNLILGVRIFPQACIQDRTTMKKHEKVKAKQNRFRTFENIVVSYCQATRTKYKIQCYYIASVLIVFATIICLF